MKSTTRDGVLRGPTALGIRLLILSAAAVSGYLLSVSLGGGNAVGCAPGSACDAVLQSRWAYVFSIPVSVFALILDAALLLTTFSAGPRSTPKQRRGAWDIMVPCALLILGAALWFIALQAFVVRRFCPWCMAAHLCGAVAAILILSRVPLVSGQGSKDRDSSIPRARFNRLALISACLIALLGVAQTVSTRQTHTVTTIPLFPTNATSSMARATSPATNAASTASTVTAAPARTSLAPAATLDVLGGRFRLDLTKVPVWGRIDAPHKLLSLYDYSCHHCRDMHSRVADVQRSFGGKLAVVSLPMPLDARCNTLMRQTPPAHRNACDYAKLGLIVWRAKHEAIEPFDDWFFGYQTPPPLVDVTNKAVEMVGRAAFEQASRDSSLDQTLSTSIAIYGVSAREFRNGSMPQFLIGTNILSGPMTTEQLRAVVAKYVK
jgi:uncharacterized membrane protein